MTNIIICLTDSYNLAKKIANNTGQQIITADLKAYSGNEYLISLPIQQKLSGRVTIIHQLWPQPNEKLMQLLMLSNCCRQAGATEIKLITPYLPYLRQDRQLRPYSNIGTEVIADLLINNNIDQIVAIDPHSPAAESFFGDSLQSVSSVELVANYIKNHFKLEDLILIAPDKGSSYRVTKIADLLNLPYSSLNKTRINEDVIIQSDKELPQKQLILIDDILDSGSTILNAVKAIYQEGKQISIIITHALNQEKLLTLAENPIIERVVASSSIGLDLTNARKINVLDISPLLVFA